VPPSFTIIDSSTVGDFDALMSSTLSSSENGRGFHGPLGFYRLEGRDFPVGAGIGFVVPQV